MWPLYEDPEKAATAWHKLMENARALFPNKRVKVVVVCENVFGTYAAIVEEIDNPGDGFTVLQRGPSTLHGAEEAIQNLLNATSGAMAEKMREIAGAISESMGNWLRDIAEAYEQSHK